MKKILSLATAIGFLGLGATANAEGFFNANELSLTTYGTYVDRQDDSWGGGVGLSYFVTRHIGLGATTHWENFSGSFIDNAAGELYLRLPLGDLPIAPYGIGSAGYNWERDAWFFGAGGGVEVRFTESIGIFGDVQYLFNEGGYKDGVEIRAGFRFNM